MRGHLRIDQMFAFVVIDDDGTEGIPAVQMGDLAMPLVGADMDRIDSLRPFAEQVAASGKRVTIVRFSNRDDLEVIEPEETR